MPNRRKYTDEQFIEAVKHSTSWRQVLQKLGLKHGGGVYVYLKKLASDLSLDTSHMKGKGWSAGQKVPARTGRPLEDYLNNKFPIATSQLKQKLWNTGLKDKKCEICGITEWQNQPAPLQLDHIDGNRNNNSLKNLRILCPNCHALTPSYCGKNIGKYK